MPKIPYTKIYMADWLSWRRKLTAETLCEILDAIADYCTFGDKPQVKPEDNHRVIEVLTTLMKWTADCEKAYQANLEKGKKGGRPKSVVKKPQDKPQVKPQDKPEINLGVKQPEPETKTEKKEKNIKKKTAFIPPTLDEIKTFCARRGIVESVAIKIFDYYTAGNWHDSAGKPILRWQQKIIAVWDKPENHIEQSKPYNPDDPEHFKL